MLKDIQRNFDINCSKKDNEYQYLTNIIDFSIENKDIKTFLLFLYLHDTLLIPNKTEDDYSNWRKSITYQYAYEIDKFSIKDIDHYNDNIIDNTDKLIKIFLSNNFSDKDDKYFIKQDSWEYIL